MIILKTISKNKQTNKPTNQQPKPGLPYPTLPYPTPTPTPTLPYPTLRYPSPGPKDADATDDYATSHHHMMPDLNKESAFFGRNPFNPSEMMTVDTIIEFTYYNDKGSLFFLVFLSFSLSFPLHHPYTPLHTLPHAHCFLRLLATLCPPLPSPPLSSLARTYPCNPQVWRTWERV